MYQPHHVFYGHLPHPLGAATAFIALGEIVHARFAQVAVHPRGIALKVLDNIAGQILVEQALYVCVAVVEFHHEIGVEVTVVTEVTRRFPRCPHVFAHQCAEVLPRVGVAGAVTQAAVVVGGDVRHAVFGPDDIGVVALGGRRINGVIGRVATGTQQGDAEREGGNFQQCCGCG